MSTCRYVASDQPRMVTGRHQDHCADDACKGCQPCTEPHCRVCGRTHADTCAECLNDVRSDLAEILRLSSHLPAEAIARGIDSEAANLAGPATDWEAWHHVQASIRVGRLPAGWAETTDHELHPLFVLGGWDAMVRDALDHSEPEGRVTIAEAADYVGRQLTYLAGYPDLPFEDLARDLRKCRAHIENALHDGTRDTIAEVNCLTCGRAFIKRMTETGIDDLWWCPGCSRSMAPHEYYLAAAHAAKMTAQDIIATAMLATEAD